MIKDDYLWDKSGNDLEIKKLENTLKTFRSSNTTPPVLPVQTFVVEKNISNSRRIFQFALAGFATLILTILSIGIFQLLQVENKDSAQVQKTSNLIQPAKQTPEMTVQTADSPSISDEEKPIQTKIRQAKFTLKAKRQFVKTEPKIIDKKASVKKFEQKSVAKKVGHKSLKSKTVYLTQEEKDAYQQLMQALAITGSQMRIVREKIRGEEKDSTRKVKR